MPSNLFTPSNKEPRRFRADAALGDCAGVDATDDLGSDAGDALVLGGGGGGVGAATRAGRGGGVASAGAGGGAVTTIGATSLGRRCAGTGFVCRRADAGNRMSSEGGLPSFSKWPVFRHISIISPVLASRTSIREFILLCGLRAQVSRARRAPGRSPRRSGMLTCLRSEGLRARSSRSPKRLHNPKIDACPAR